jgi:Fur family peroxide stress response transcriptional regulator
LLKVVFPDKQVDMESFQGKRAAFENACKEAGLRLTHQRLEIYSELAVAADHPTADTIYQRIRKKIPTISLDTVYRTLATFASHGLINKIETVESQARFEVKIMRHHHVICRKCNMITDFQWESLDDVNLPVEISRWGRVENKNVIVYGICSECMEAGMK